MPDVAASYGMPFDFTTFFLDIDHSCMNYCISTKLSLIMYLSNTDMSKCQM